MNFTLGKWKTYLSHQNISLKEIDPILESELEVSPTPKEILRLVWEQITSGYGGHDGR